MIKVALRGLAGRKLRASLTAFAIVLGVAMVSGTFVLTDTMNGAFDSIISQSYKNADVVVSGKTAFDTDTNGNAVQPPSFPETLLAKIKANGGRVLSRNEELVEWSDTIRNVFVKDPNGLNLELVGSADPNL